MAAKQEQVGDFVPGPRGGREAMSWNIWQSEQSAGSLPPGPGSESGQCCVYNQTCERFLSVDVEAADFTVSGLDIRLQSFSPTGGTALWLVPFRGISPTSVRLPLDLLYLDHECAVIEAVESFPIFHVSTSSRPAASVLVLPAQSIASTGTRAGDQLIFRPPAEMKLALEQLARIKAEGPQVRPEAQASGADQGLNLHHVLPWKDVSRLEPLPADTDPSTTPEWIAASLASGSPAQPASALPAQSDPEPVAQQATQNQESSPKKKQSWLERFLTVKPEDKRGASRESIPGLTAFFFTGGAPVPHGIRDISETGVYVITDERWYPGTVVHMTLTDQREPTVERSFTANAVVMRWGNDGVGFHFVFHDTKGRRRGKLSFQERVIGIADPDSFKGFLGILRGQSA
jgi:hypothetical protein